MKILIFTDFVARGNIGGSQISKILTYKGYDVFFLPTALISNAFSLTSNSVVDQSSFARQSLKNRTEMGIKFDAVFIGTLRNSGQKDLILSFIGEGNKRPVVFLDPVIGDKGKLYKSIDKKILGTYKDLLKKSDFLICNLTEAGFLTDTPDFDPVKILKKLNTANPVITSVKEGETYFVETTDFKLPFKRIDRDFYGSGDIFDAFFMAYYLKSRDFHGAIEKSVATVSKILSESYKNSLGHEVVIERFLDLI